MHPEKQTGFTLIELLVVLVIIGLLSGLVGPRLFGELDKSKVKAAQSQVQLLRGSLQTFQLDVGRFPTRQEGLKSLEVQPSGLEGRWQGPYVSDPVPLDPWGSPYQYEPAPAKLAGIVLYSLGADGKPGGEGSAQDVGLLP